MKSLEQKRDEKAKLVHEHFDKIGAATFDVFKYGWDACAKEYEKENAAMKTALKEIWTSEFVNWGEGSDFQKYVDEQFKKLNL